MKTSAGFKKALATLGAVMLAMASLTAGAALVTNLTNKMIDSCYCHSMGGKMVCSGTCQAAGECCCCTPQNNNSR